jgi:putative transposase
MQFEEGYIYHVYNRGNDKQPIFFGESNYYFFLEKIQKHICPHCDILAWCLMPNHFHFLIYANRLSGEPFKTKPFVMSRLSYEFGSMLSSYSKAINNQEGKTGNLFQQKTKSKLVNEGSENYTVTAFHYIHQNPLKAGLVGKMEDWRFSSFNQYLGVKESKKLCNKELAVELLNLDLRTFKDDSYAVLNDTLLQKIF